MKPITMLALAATLAAATAGASQYPLDQVTTIISSEHAPKLRRAGVRSTADFLVWGRTAEGRRLLADRARLPIEQVTSWVMLADLMRVRGIGPDVARLLTAAGVKSLADLQRCDAEGIASLVRDVNKKTHLSSNPPGAESIRYWIVQSQSLPIIVSLE